VIRSRSPPLLSAFRHSCSFDLPPDSPTRAQRNQRFVAERVLPRNFPFLAHQGDGVLVSRQSVEIRAVEAGKALELVQGAGFLERFGVELDGGVSGIDPGAAAGGLLAAAGMGRAVGSEK